MSERPPSRGRRPAPDPARAAALELLLAVEQDGAYANLALPSILAERGLTGRDAALATELAYGTARAAGTLLDIVDRSLDRPAQELEIPVRCLLQLGAYQLLRTRIPPHAAVSATVELARNEGHARVAGLINAVLRRVAAADWDTWTDRLSDGASGLQQAAMRTAHPEWIAAAFAASLGEPTDGDLAETRAALAADDERPQTHLVAWPGRMNRADLVAEAGGRPAPYSPFGVRLDGGDPGRVASVRSHRAAVQDEGSQLCALALTAVPIEGPDERWADLCAGPGGKAAMLAATAAGRVHPPTVLANELRPHRAELVRSATAGWENVEVRVGDARELRPPAAGFDRVLLDAPCTGLGALRRRPEARWRRQVEDVAELAALQRSLLAAAIALTRPGGVVAYVTCSPHPEETTAVVRAVLAADPTAADVLDARSGFAGVDRLGDGPFVQLWPHRHGTDAMFAALLRRR